MSLRVEIPARRRVVEGASAAAPAGVGEAAAAENITACITKFVVAALQKAHKFCTSKSMGHIVIGDAVAVGTSPGLMGGDEGYDAGADAGVVIRYLVGYVQQRCDEKCFEPHFAWTGGYAVVACPLMSAVCQGKELLGATRENGARG